MEFLFSCSIQGKTKIIKKKMRFSITCEFLALTRKILGKKCFFFNLFIVAYFLWLSRLRPSIESC